MGNTQTTSSSGNFFQVPTDKQTDVNTTINNHTENKQPVVSSINQIDVQNLVELSNYELILTLLRLEKEDNYSLQNTAILLELGDRTLKSAFCIEMYGFENGADILRLKHLGKSVSILITDETTEAEFKKQLHTNYRPDNSLAEKTEVKEKKLTQDLNDEIETITKFFSERKIKFSEEKIIEHAKKELYREKENTKHSAYDNNRMAALLYLRAIATGDNRGFEKLAKLPDKIIAFHIFGPLMVAKQLNIKMTTDEKVKYLGMLINSIPSNIEIKKYHGSFPTKSNYNSFNGLKLLSVFKKTLKKLENLQKELALNNNILTL